MKPQKEGPAAANAGPELRHSHDRVLAKHQHRNKTAAALDSPAFHPLADIFPLMEGAEFAEHVADIKKHGVRLPITMLDGLVLDGRNRVRAAAAARVEIPPDMFRVFDPKIDGDPLAFVISANVKRRHLNASQRAWIASEVETLKQHGGDRKTKPAADQDAELHLDREAAAKMFNVSPRSVANAALIRSSAEPELRHAVEQGRLTVDLGAKAARLSRRLQLKVAQDAAEGNLRVVRVVVKKELREQKVAALGDKLKALPDERFGVIYADPPWKFEAWDIDSGGNGLADNHYPCSPLDEIKNLLVPPSPPIAARDAALFLWATAPMLREAMEVMACWGFHYVSQCIWNKNKTGLGYWFRNRHEILLIGTRGSIPAPAPGTQFPSVIDASVGKHSEKPAVFAEMIEQYFPGLPKIELYCRGKPRPGWSAWGAEAVVDEAAE
jgi:N6-adenosine-specific RNA methylase IME4